MKGYWDAQLTRALALTPGSNYSIKYTYDDAGRVTAEVVTGSVERTTHYTYDEDDNIVTEVSVTEGMTITKTYSYTDGNITDVTVDVL